MSLESSIKEVCAGLKVGRVTERKKNAEKLKEFLSMNGVLILLTENTSKKKGYTWNQLFDNINEYIIKEIEKYETSKTFSSVTVPLCTSLLHLCVAGANKGQAYIKCEIIMEACLGILKDTYQTKAIGDAFLSLLFRHILPHHYYLSYITPTTWEDLLDVCITACLTNHSKLDDFTKLRLVLLVMKSGVNNCQFVIPMRKSLSDLKKVFLKVAGDKKVQEVVIEIVILLLETLAMECRLTMCEFTETQSLSFLKFYDQNMDQKKKALLFKMLCLIVMLHHPEGRSQNEEGSLANNWNLWNKHLNNIVEVICLEVTYLQKLRKQDEIRNQSAQLYELAARVYFQKFQMVVPTENEDGNSSKRQRLGFNNNKSFNDLIDELRQNHVPWLGIIHVYVKEYGSFVDSEDYFTLLSVIEVMITNAMNNLNWDIFEKLANVVFYHLTPRYVKRMEINEYIFVSLWNACIRYSTSLTAAHKPLHIVIQSLITLNVLKYQNVQTLTKLYLDKGMPVTTHSVTTLYYLYSKYYSKFNNTDVRVKCLEWLTQGDVTSAGTSSIRELILRIMANENVNINQIHNKISEYNDLNDALFDSYDKGILFSELELAKSDTPAATDSCIKMIIIDMDMKNRIEDYLTDTFNAYIKNISTKNVPAHEYAKFVHIMLTYLDIILKNRPMLSERPCEHMYYILKKGMKLLFSTVIHTLEDSGVRIPDKVNLIQHIRHILESEFDSQLNVEIRSCIDQDYFHCINNILNTDISTCEEVICEEEEEEINSKTLRHNCILMLAAYCRKRVAYREEILELILDAKLYNFKTDLQCAFKCIELLRDSSVEETPIELLFTFMQQMCKDLYRDSKASLGILKALLSMLDFIWAQESMRKNCFIMIKSYMLRCQMLYYPTRVAGLIYECVARVAIMNRTHGSDATMLEEALVNKLKGDIHTIRLYCCYLMKILIKDYSDSDIQAFLKGFLDIFVINVSDRTESILKDESANRTLTVFHCYLALIQAKMPYVQTIVTEILHLKKEKSLDTILVKKILSKIVKTVGEDDLESYLAKNMLSIIYNWFSRNNSIEDIPIDLFGYEHANDFLKSHMKLLVAGDLLWRGKGNMQASQVVRRIITEDQKLSVEYVIEICFSDIIILCLPYIVVDKYKIDFIGFENPRVLSQSVLSANKVFRSTGQMLENEKWSNLFVENLGDLVMLAAAHLCDYEDAEKLFQLNIPRQARAYHYPKKVFLAILNYFGNLTDGNIMQYLCENQPLAIFKIMCKLWEKVLGEPIIECRILAMHAFVTFIENIPLEFSSDSFVWNYTCKCIANAIKICQNSEDLKMYLTGLKIVLNIFLPEKMSLIRKSMLQVVPILAMKVEGGCAAECTTLLNYLLNDLKLPLNRSQDVTDFVPAPSQGTCSQAICASAEMFTEKLQRHKSNLSCPSLETLKNMHQLLKINKRHIKYWYNNFESKGFSEDCGTSIVHQTICMLNNILKSTCDIKIKIAACDCLSEIGMYDLKTLVTVPPEDTAKMTTLNPKSYFARALVMALAEVIYDEDPKVTSNVVETLNCLLKNRESDNIDLGEIDEEILKPFSNSSCAMPNEVTINYQNFDNYRADFSDGIFLKHVSSWSTDCNRNHEVWLEKVTTTLLSIIDTGDNYITLLQPVCASKPNVCRRILPSLIGLIIYYSTDSYISLLSEHIMKFYKYIWEQTFNDQMDSSSHSPTPAKKFSVDHGHKLVIQYMLEVVDFIRLQSIYYNSVRDGSISRLNYLKLEYDQVSWAAAFADQTLPAIYYGELCASALNNGVPPASPESTTNLSGGEYIQRIFRKCYVSIGDFDAIEGCGTAHLTLEDEKRKYLTDTGQHSAALLQLDVALSCGPPQQRLQRDVVTALHHSAMHHLALQYINSLPETDEFNDVKYECLSFLGDWSDYVDTKSLEVKSIQPNCNPNSIIKAFRYACLKNTLSLPTTPDLENRLELPIDQAKIAVTQLCQTLNMENCQSVYNILGRLHLFTDIEDYSAVRTNKTSFQDLLRRWQMENVPSFNNFKHLEALISQRVMILEHAAKSNSDFYQEIVSLQIQYAELALSNNRIEISQRLLAVVKKMRSSEDVTFVESKISWAKGHKEIALSLLRNIINKQSPDVKLNAVSLRQYALWMAETKRENARDIIDKYLHKSLQVLTEEDHLETRLQVYYDIAKFADTEYKQVDSYMNSASFEMKVKCMESMKGTAFSLRATQQQKSLTSDQRKAYFTNDRFRALEEGEIASTKAEKERFLHLAMRYYLLSLKQCEENNLSIFRVISLWLDNPHFEFSDGAVFEELLQSIPSRKFITVLPQLVPRLTDEDSDFARILTRVISRCAREHPHHTLPLVLSLHNSSRDGPPTPVSPRCRAASALLAALRSAGTSPHIIPQMEQLCNATITFANYEPESKTTFKKQKIPKSQSIHKLVGLDAIPIPTALVPIRNDCQYLNLPTIHAFDSYFELVGGINFPKKIICTDSTGTKRILLIKGKDDLRQDAVVQQVFNIVNTLLEKNPITSANKLLIRTYKVVPMSRQSGVLEWCEGTVPMGGYLAGTANNGAHARYRPQDIPCIEARKKFAKCADKPNHVKLQVFNSILREFKPVFHYFFTEHYLDPVTWYERRLAYIKSVAASSMVGYILGLGDRHVQNILIDKRTAEVIHIDFGIAFDHGKTHNTPETVPFRLTQDMIAGFGCSGVEGIFRRCCEKTMQLLRDNQEILLTILKVLLCDPLYTWTVSPSSTQHSETTNNADTTCPGASECNSGLAEHALLTVSSRLGGAQGGTQGGVAVPGQVAHLLHAATDPVNLCRLYSGWQPYL